ncbi:MAG TPA: Stp1/IreP family PP2C-type Ser/Thr phosphatase [Noviherbaspirillum sp.]|uniref:Stp1/IreP family PP2C-type Ser/Thr phosphatase n=1 Tax=Noviherbaspirillum sp. TaxID=1926288 RepID=UPI002D67CA64|nr:Stp1/IreP family PP2C-type Ser/Thr phosphatase [Noviherbaspirillum sp.]HYD95361.1 Stp1/IreP family PP2C-type Ser/Thr phosphatase [Noviherbaspirillum sp.]
MSTDLELQFAGKTDTGLVRAQNEDAIAIHPAHGFVVLADGMGGYNAGEVASSMATAVISERLSQGLDTLRQNRDAAQRHKQLHQLMDDALQDANKAILAAARAEPQYEGMGTTVVAAVFHPDGLTVAHVGDSRAYRFRRGELAQITRDHSLLQEQIDAGLLDPALARFSQSKNLVTRAVGVGAAMEVEIHDHPVQAGDVYLLCSDGLSDMLQDAEIAAVLARAPAVLDAACDTLVQKANGNGGLDNISVVLARVQAGGGQASGLLHRILNWVS